jgi:hypothetical protein
MERAKSPSLAIPPLSILRNLSRSLPRARSSMLLEEMTKMKKKMTVLASHSLT